MTQVDQNPNQNTKTQIKDFYVIDHKYPCLSCGSMSSVISFVVLGSDVSGSKKYPEKLYYLSMIEDIDLSAVSRFPNLYYEREMMFGDRYLVNHCDSCGAKFNDAKILRVLSGPEAELPIEDIRQLMQQQRREIEAICDLMPIVGRNHDD